MGRDTGTKENKASDANASAVQASQLARSNEAMDRYNSILGAVRGGKPESAIANPWADPTFLNNQNLAIASGTSAANKSGQELLNTSARQSGENTAGRRATIADLTRGAMRTRTDTQVQQNLNNRNNYQDWQKYILDATAKPAGVSSNLYGTATGQRQQADKSLADIGMASQQMWGNILSSAIGGASAMGSAGIKACWVAAELYGGWDVLPTRLVRAWLTEWAERSLVGRAVVALYARHGRAAAALVRRHHSARVVAAKVFKVILKRALTAQEG